MLVFIPAWYLDRRREENQMVELHREKYFEYKKAGIFFPRMIKNNQR